MSFDYRRLRPDRVVRGIGRRIEWRLAPRREARRQAALVERIEAMTRERFGDLAAVPPLRLHYDDQLHHRFDMVIRRDGSGFVVELPRHRQDSTIGNVGHLGSTYLYWLMQCDSSVEEMPVTLADGDRTSRMRFAPSTNLSQMVPIPDPYFFMNRGFDSWVQIADRAPAWGDRSEELLWRGACAGVGTFDPQLGAAVPARASQRLELVLAAARIPGFDAGLLAATGKEFSPAGLEATGLVKPFVAQESWQNRKYAIDVDGWSNTWSNLLIRMHLGCCVLKLDSKFGYRQWYYDRIRPWEHYVPVKADCSDLAEQIDWVRSHDAEAAAIAANGQRFARTLTFESGKREAIELITTHWRR